MTAWVRDVATIDFESLQIRPRPEYPPAPVGVSIKIGSRKPKYYSWGHPSGGNKHTWSDARSALGEVYESRRPVLFHNERFDSDISETHMDLPSLPWERRHDTLPMLFLLDPRAQTYQLKPSAEKLFDLSPDERDAVEEWLLEHQPIPGVKLSKSRKSPLYAGGFIAFAPPSIVGPYANGDVDRTHMIAKHCVAELKARGMLEAYDRERELSAKLMGMERSGMRVNEQALERDLRKYTKVVERLEEWLFKKLKNKDVNLDSGPQLAKALVKARLAKEEDFGLTTTGLMQTNKTALKAAVKNPQLLSVLTYRTQLNTCVRTFMSPWLETASRSDGLIFTQWHSTRHDKGGGSVGTRTGRMSSTPNFMNIPKSFRVLFRDRQNPKLPEAPVKLPKLPAVRSYVVPYTDDHVLIGRDFDSQELRMLAHFEDDQLSRAYLADVNLDVHQYIADMLAEALGRDFPRKGAKTINFGILYGMGLGSLAEGLDTTYDQAKHIRKTYFKIFPGVQTLIKDLTQRGKQNLPIRTLGGRVYYVEPPKVIKNRLRDFSYKLINYLIQGSSADLTKDSMLAFLRDPGPSLLHMNVHDELVASAPKQHWRREMERLKIAMNADRLDVPMMSSGAVGENWASMKPCD